MGSPATPGSLGQDVQIRRTRREVGVPALNVSEAEDEPLPGLHRPVEPGSELGHEGVDGRLPAQRHDLGSVTARLLARGLYRARLTKSAIRARDVSAAAEGMKVLAGVAPLVTSRRLSIHVGHILTDTRTWARVREVGEARERLREITR
jgi:hypothetical protein